MDEIFYFSEQPDTDDIPERMRDPFANDPDSLAIKASHELQSRLEVMPEVMQVLNEPDGGKMFGVLVVSDAHGRVGYLSAFSGMLNQRWGVPGFVPPIFDADAQKQFLPSGECQLDELSIEIQRHLESAAYQNALNRLHLIDENNSEEIDSLKHQYRMNKKERARQRDDLITVQDEVIRISRLRELSSESQQDKRAVKETRREGQERLKEAQYLFMVNHESPISNLRKQRRTLSRKLHKRVFDTYQLHKGAIETVALRTLFDGMLPPGGTGDCAAPKLIQFANKHQLKMLALTEFWWGSPPKKSVRHHGHFYPPCRGKCKPILPAMLTGVELKISNARPEVGAIEPDIVFEDEFLVVLNKPAGLLSVPGKIERDSVHDWLQRRYPDLSPMLVHRLDMATSGLLLTAKSTHAHKILQKQFIQRQVRKRYVAVLSKPISLSETTIELPLRVDLDDRPRQLVCYEHGKSAKTRVELISSNEGSSRVYFYPVTGRTHQLRIHAAHKDGLNAAIVGDALYGESAERLMLHAEKLSFEHPDSGQMVKLTARPPF